MLQTQIFTTTENNILGHYRVKSNYLFSAIRKHSLNFVLGENPFFLDKILIKNLVHFRCAKIL